MNEIGGYFGLESLISNPYYSDAISLNAGRNALVYLVMAKKIMKVYLPFLICDSITNVLSKNGIVFEFYKIGQNFEILFSKELRQDEYLYIINFYGQFSNDYINMLKEKYKKIIIDNTQAFFLEPSKGVDTIYSLRKYFGLPDGAYLFTDKRLNEELDFHKSANSMAHILGRYEGVASDYYNDFLENGLRLENSNLLRMSRITQNLLGAIDYEYVRNTRNKNFSFLAEKLSKFNGLNLKKCDGPFAYPLYIPNAQKIRNELIKKKIYIPILWPNVIKDLESNDVEYDLAMNILPIPCDQRYGIKEMRFIVKEVIKCTS